MTKVCNLSRSWQILKMQAGRGQAAGLKRLALYDWNTRIHMKALCCRACESPDLTLSGNE